MLLSPSERAVIEVLFDNIGTFTIENRTPAKTYTLGMVIVANTPISQSYALEFTQIRGNKETVASINPFRAYFDKSPDKSITLSIAMAGMGTMGGMSGMGGGHRMPDSSMMSGEMTVASKGDEGNIEWEEGASKMMNAMSNTDMVTWNIIDQATGEKNMDIDWQFKKGDRVKVRIFNDPQSAHPMQHPIHFHGQRFLVLERDGIRQTNLVWKDTVFVKSSETVDILLDASNVGTWMTHCHIAEHAEAGMMFKFEVTE